MEVLTPKGVYRTLWNMQLGVEELAKMRLEFWADDHEIWTKDVPPEQQVERLRQWKDLNEKLQTEMETIGKEPDGSAESLLDQVQVTNRERYDYKKFLRKFAILKEEMQVDTDSFDYIFYKIIYFIRIFAFLFSICLKLFSQALKYRIGKYPSYPQFLFGFSPLHS